MTEAVQTNTPITETDQDSFCIIFTSANRELVQRTIQSLTTCCGEEREKVVIALGSLTESSQDHWRRQYAIEGLSRLVDGKSIPVLAKIWSDCNQPSWIRALAGRALREIDKAQTERTGNQQQEGQETREDRATRSAVVALNQIFGSSPDPREDKSS